MSRNKDLKYLTLCVMNLYNIWFSLSEMSDKNIDIDMILYFSFLYEPVLCVLYQVTM